MYLFSTRSPLVGMGLHQSPHFVAIIIIIMPITIENILLVSVMQKLTQLRDDFSLRQIHNLY